MIDAPVSNADFGLYVHFPWCHRLCPYCDFNVHVGRFDGARYRDTILAELNQRADPFSNCGPLRSIYFGGGTPSLWGADEIGSVIEAATTRFGLHPDSEITLEANPEDRDALPNLIAAGVNRISLGAQSFFDDELRFLGRVHHADDTARAVDVARQAGASISLDLIYGLPDQSSDAVVANVEKTLALQPEHVAAYTLTIEPTTNFGRRAARNRLTPAPDDEVADRMERVVADFEAAGYEHYEVSAFARDGAVAIHNSLYWVGAPYLGLGAGAHGYRPAPGLASAERWENQRQPDAYERSARGEVPDPQMLETLDRTETVGERLIVAMRAGWGIDLEALAQQACCDDLSARLGSEIDRLVADGALERHGARIAPTPAGMFIADTVARRLVEALGTLAPADW